MGVLDLLAQIAPAQAYAEALHQSGLFAYIAKALYDDTVCPVYLMSFVNFSISCETGGRWPGDYLHIFLGSDSDRRQASLPTASCVFSTYN